MIKKVLLLVFLTIFVCACTMNKHTHILSKRDQCRSLRNRMISLDHDHNKMEHWQYRKRRLQMRDEYRKLQCQQFVFGAI